MENKLVIFRGGGDVATGSIQKVKRAGFNVLVLDIKNPTCIRKKVSISQAIFDGEVVIEDIKAVKCNNIDEIYEAFDDGNVAVYIDEEGKLIDKLKPLAVIDAIIAKKNLGTNIDMAPITIALGPGFVAGRDCDIVIETNRGHDLGRLIFDGPAHKNTGNPGDIEGYTTERILRAPNKGIIKVLKDIGSEVKKGEVVALVDGGEVRAGLSGMIRGMINDGLYVYEGMKIGDVDPRVIPKNAFTISDKARNIGGGVLEALLILIKEKNL